MPIILPPITRRQFIKGSIALGGLGQDLAPQLCGVVLEDGKLHRAGGENVAFLLEHFLRVDGFGLGKAGNCSMLCEMFAKFGQVFFVSLQMAPCTSETPLMDMP